MTIKKIIEILKIKTKDFNPTLIEQISKEYGKDPFIILICCLLSLRAKDVVTINVCRMLLKKAKTPQDLLNLSLQKLEKIIFKIGFYRNKAKTLHKASNYILQKYQGEVPQTLQKLLQIPGVGSKTANLVLGMAFNKPTICVDIHVHRISNRLGIIKTKTPEETKIALQKIIPKKDWILWNNLLVKWGQNICTPRHPKCSICTISKYCKKVNVKNSR